MTSLWRHSRLTYYDLGPNFLTQGVELLPGEAWQVFKAKFLVLQELFAKNHRGALFSFTPHIKPPSGARVKVTISDLWWAFCPTPKWAYYPALVNGLFTFPCIHDPSDCDDAIQDESRWVAYRVPSALVSPARLSSTIFSGHRLRLSTVTPSLGALDSYGSTQSNSYAVSSAVPAPCRAPGPGMSPFKYDTGPPKHIFFRSIRRWNVYNMYCRKQHFYIQRWTAFRQLHTIGVTGLFTFFCHPAPLPFV